MRCFTTSRGGAGKARFDTDPRKNDQTLGVDPRGRTVGVVNAAGAVVLAATLAEGGQIGGADTRCCLPDGGGDGAPECEDRTPAECAAQGGIDLGPGSCLPNPCEGSTPPPAGSDIRCCVPDGGGDGPAECEDRTPAQCAALGGVIIGAGTCAYTARVSSGANAATAPAQDAIGDEVEFDFDSNGGDIAAGATAIPSTFIQNLQVTGELRDASGAVVATHVATCLAR